MTKEITIVATHVNVAKVITLSNFHLLSGGREIHHFTNPTTALFIRIRLKNNFARTIWKLFFCQESLS